MFTGKNEIAFYNWLMKWKGNREYFPSFQDLHFSMQQGIYLEYLDSIGYYIDNRQNPYKIGVYEYFIWNDSVTSKKRILGEGFKSRSEALTEAFKKADELINKG